MSLSRRAYKCRPGLLIRKVLRWRSCVFTEMGSYFVQWHKFVVQARRERWKVGVLIKLGSSWKYMWNRIHPQYLCLGKRTIDILWLNLLPHMFQKKPHSHALNFTYSKIVSLHCTQTKTLFSVKFEFWLKDILRFLIS